MRTRLPLLLVLLAISGCARYGEVSEREEYWKAEAESFFQSPRNMNDLHSWLRERQVFYTYEDHEIVDGEWAQVLEKIYVDGIVCESWAILLRVTVGGEGEVLTHSVRSSGTCL